jgi:PAS domain-containing protein
MKRDETSVGAAVIHGAPQIRALGVSEQRFRGVFEGAAIGIAIADLASGRLTKNFTFQKMLGCTPDEMNSVSNFDQLTHPDDREADNRRIQRMPNGEYDRMPRKNIMFFGMVRRFGPASRDQSCGKLRIVRRRPGQFCQGCHCRTIWSQWAGFSLVIFKLYVNLILALGPSANG